jgi:hypothetical protein
MFNLQPSSDAPHFGQAVCRSSKVTGKLLQNHVTHTGLSRYRVCFQHLTFVCFALSVVTEFHNVAAPIALVLYRSGVWTRTCLNVGINCDTHKDLVHTSLYQFLYVRYDR